MTSVSSSPSSAPLLHILWDESHIWGLLAVRAARAMELPHRLVRAADIAGGLLERERPAMLLVPGGNARHKAESLGAEGVEAIRAYVARGGQYLGFCGGAGLALSWPGGLALCPWVRAGYDERMQHFMSGHMRVSLPQGQGARHSLCEGMPASPLLPVWWPGRFEKSASENILVLAAYEEPGEDFWLADLPIAALPPDIFAAWRDMYGFSLTPSFLKGQPCLVHGAFGRGGYTLSYSHLETPLSPDANLWLARLLERLAGLCPKTFLIPAWDVQDSIPHWHDKDLLTLEGLLDEALTLGMRHGLLFERTPWLFGWRAGIPGANLNNLRAALSCARALPAAPAALEFWKNERGECMRAARAFHKGCTEYLLAERLAMTLAKTLPGTLPPELLKNQRAALFGPPMQPGGPYRDLMRVLDTLSFLQLAMNGV